MDKQMTFGAIPSPYDPRDYSVKMIRAVTFPEEYEQPDVEIYDQGSMGRQRRTIRGGGHGVRRCIADGYRRAQNTQPNDRKS